MSTKEKLIKRFLALPKDFTFDELTKLLVALGFSMSNKGKTSGSRVKFTNSQEPATIVQIHKPHTSGSPIKENALRDIQTKLIVANLIKTDTDNQN
ncbi:hypothetical protein FACS189467_2530 [Bacteroidia bacterium]|nr:hypothetical protein FACS189467_2530 [Bacteroidia bacterium]